MPRYDQARSSITISSGFTLLELLVVVAIMGILMVAGSSLFNSMTGGNVKQRAGANDLVSMIDQARSQALASGEDRYLAFATEDTNFQAGQRFRVMAIFRRNPDTAATGSARFIRETPWKALPTGVAFLNTSTGPNVLSGGVKESFENGNVSVQAPYILFSPQGAIVTPYVSQPSEIAVYIFRGNYNGSTPTASHKNTAGKPVTDKITVSRFTGRVKHMTDV